MADAIIPMEVRVYLVGVMDVISTVALSRPAMIKMPMVYNRLRRRKIDGIWEAYIGSTLDNTQREDKHHHGLDRDIYDDTGIRPLVLLPTGSHYYILKFWESIILVLLGKAWPVQWTASMSGGSYQRIPLNEGYSGETYCTGCRKECDKDLLKAAHPTKQHLSMLCPACSLDRNAVGAADWWSPQSRWDTRNWQLYMERFGA